jgi:phosphoglycerate dehydrogenase-like enzyme
MLDLVEQELDGITVVFAIDPDEVDRALPECDAVLDAYMNVPFTASRLAGAEKLSVIVTATTGSDHIDSDALAGRGILVLTLKGQTELLSKLTPAAEHSWLLLLACARGLNGASSHVLGGGWDRNLFPGVMLRGTTLGLVGCGRIGRMMARYAGAFDMNCIGYDPHADPWPDSIQRVSLNAVMEDSDFVSVHVHLTEETKGLVGKSELDRVKSGAVLINTSRGAVVDETALLDALSSRRLRAAGLDVLTSEPDTANDPLVEYARTHDNLLITPHIGGFSPGALTTVLRFSCGRVKDALGD